MDAPDTDITNKPDDYVDYGNVSINSAGEYKLSPAYTEILRLHEMLEQNGIPHEFHRMYDGWRVCYPDGDQWRISAVQHYGSYGAADNQIEIMGVEIMGGIAPEDGRCGGVLGYLTAANVYKRIAKMHGKPAVDNAEHCIVCGEVIPEGRQVCPGCEGGDTQCP